MRPAQKAPENAALRRVQRLRIGRFNEAGAKSAGKRATGFCPPASTRPSFNEAGAKSAGKHYRMAARSADRRPLQ